MIEFAFDYVTQAMDAVENWFFAIVDRLELTSIILIMIAVLLTFSLLLMPLRGAAISGINEHTVNKITKKKNTSNPNAKLKSK